MLLSEKKEREYRFRLALRIGLPIFGLILILVFTTLINNYENLNAAFYIESALLLFVSVYFILYMIYKGFDVKITDSVSKVFTREYFYSYIKSHIEKEKTCTFILVSVTNILDINAQYGLKNGDKVLKKVAQWIADFLESKELYDFPIGRIKGGDFIVALSKDLLEHKVILELLALKSDGLNIDGIEIEIAVTGIDTTYSKNVDHLIDALYDQLENIKQKKEIDTDRIDPNELELLVIDAIKNRSLSIASQKVFDKDKNEVFEEIYVRLKAKNGKFIHQKKYIKVINKLGLTLDFDKVLVAEIYKKIANKKINVVLNISTSSLRNIEFLKYLQYLEKKQPNIAKKIYFLFSENEYFGKVERFNTIINSYKTLGFRFVLDKLGSLHSSFLYLRDLDIDVVRFCSNYTKGDKVFEYKAILSGFVTMIKEKEIKSWVKMVETQEQFDAFENLGIDYFQGKYLAMIQEESLS